MRRKFIFISRKIGTEEASKPIILEDIFTLADQGRVNPSPPHVLKKNYERSNKK